MPASEQGVSIKRRKRSEPPVWRHQAYPSHILEHSLYIPFFIFVVRSFNPKTLYQRASEYYRENKITKEEQIDGIFIANSGILSNIKHKERNPWHTHLQDGWYFEHWGEATPAGILLYLGNSFASHPPFTTPITTRVLTNLGKEIRITRLGDSIQ